MSRVKIVKEIKTDLLIFLLCLLSRRKQTR